MTDQAQETTLPAKPAPAAPVINLSGSGALTPGNFEGLWRMSTIIASSGLAPKGLEKTESIFVAIQLGLEVGLMPMQALQNVANINGRPSVWGDAVLGLVEASGLLEEFKETKAGTFPQDDYTHVCYAKRKGGREATQEFSIADAKLAGLWKKAGPWTSYPKRMLQMRARSWALRDLFPDVLKGIRMAEEVMDDDLELVPNGNGTYAARPTAAGSVKAKTISKTEDLKTRLKAASPKDPEEDPDPVGPGPGKESPCNGGQDSLQGGQSSKSAREGAQEAEPETNGNGQAKGPNSDPWAEENWIRLKQTGFSSHVWTHIEALKTQPPEMIEKVREKWSRVCSRIDFPLDLTDAADDGEDEDTQNPSASGATEPKSGPGAPGNGNGQAPGENGQELSYEEMEIRLGEIKEGDFDLWSRACIKVGCIPNIIPPAPVIRKRLWDTLRGMASSAHGRAAGWEVTSDDGMQF